MLILLQLSPQQRVGGKAFGQQPPDKAQQGKEEEGDPQLQRTGAAEGGNVDADVVRTIGDGEQEDTGGAKRCPGERRGIVDFGLPPAADSKQDGDQSQQADEALVGDGLQAKCAQAPMPRQCPVRMLFWPAGLSVCAQSRVSKNRSSMLVLV